MVVRKRCLLWDYTNTQGVPDSINQVNFTGPIHSVSNWNAWYPQELKQRLPFRPMVRTPAQTGGSEWAWLADGAFPYDMVHFYNEPERQQGITPKAAADVWRSHMVNVLRNQKHKKLIGPSCASDAHGQNWLKEFMSFVHDCRPDYLGLHWYGTDAGSCKKFIEEHHRQYNLPIIVSEMASTDHDAASVDRFTVDMANWMDAQAYVFEYGFFGCMRHVADSFVSPAAQLMDAQGKFSPLMDKLNQQQPMHY